MKGLGNVCLGKICFLFMGFNENGKRPIGCLKVPRSDWVMFGYVIDTYSFFLLESFHRLRFDRLLYERENTFLKRLGNVFFFFCHWIEEIGYSAEKMPDKLRGKSSLDKIIFHGPGTNVILHAQLWSKLYRSARLF